MAYAVGDPEAAGHAAVTLSDHGADLQAAFVPALGMIGCSLRHRGDELLGLPMHGLLAAYPHWRVSERGADDAGARLVATLDFAADPVLLAAFPFPPCAR